MSERNKTIPAVGYVRRSTNKQEKSLEDQRYEIERHADLEGSRDWAGSPRNCQISQEVSFRVTSRCATLRQALAPVQTTSKGCSTTSTGPQRGRPSPTKSVTPTYH